MNIALIHSHYDKQHLAEVIEEMRVLGAPTIKAVWIECYGHWAALEGCHRIRAAKELGLVPEIEEIEYSDANLCEATGNEDADEGMTVAEVCNTNLHYVTIVELEE